LGDFSDIAIYLIAFIWVMFASAYASTFFQRIKLPLITGFLVAGLICGPHVLAFLPAESISGLNFINDLSLAFIALAAGNELFLKEVRSQLKSIAWNVFGQLVVTFIFSAAAVYWLSDYIPFMREMPSLVKVAVAILVATIFVARSPSSAIAVINEMRAKGPFTQMSIGVTVIKDVLVILLFAICFSVARTLVSGKDLDLSVLLVLVAELAVAMGVGYALFKAIQLVFTIRFPSFVKGVLVLAMGYGVFYLSHWTAEVTKPWLDNGFHYEPLLACIAASFLLTNYSRFRAEFTTFVEYFGLPVYAAFFTLTGASLSIDVLWKVWMVALILFGVRLVSLILGSVTGASLAGDPPLFRKIGWMPFVTQAGVGLGLATQVALEFPAWGTEFASIIVAVIVLNQFLGPPLFKWALIKVKEAHLPASSPEFDGTRDAFIFGTDPQGWTLARQLMAHNWNAEVVGNRGLFRPEDSKDVVHHQLKSLDLEALESINIRKGDAVVLLLSDEENLELCNTIREKVGIKDIVVRLNERSNFDAFHELGALIVEPSTATVSLLDQFVRSPVAASLLLGTEDAQQTMDIEVSDEEMHGMFIRDLRFPSDTIILSVKRKDEIIISHGYTRLRLGDIVSVVGSSESLEKIRLRFESVRE